MTQEKQKQGREAARRHVHAQEVRRQVRGKEEARIAERRTFFDEGIRLDQEAKDRYIKGGSGCVSQ